MALDTIGSIATHISENFPDLPAGVSGNLVEIVDLARINVENFTGVNIGSNSIAEAYQHPITFFSKADTVDLTYSWAGIVSASGTAQVGGGASASIEKVKLEGLEVSEGAGGGEVSALKALGGLTQNASQQFRQMAENSLKYIGRKVRFAKTLV